MLRAFAAAGIGALVLVSGARAASGWVDVPADLGAPPPAAPAAQAPPPGRAAAPAPAPAPVAGPAGAPLAGERPRKIDVTPASGAVPVPPRQDEPARRDEIAAREPVRDAGRGPVQDPLGEALARALPGVPGQPEPNRQEEARERPRERAARSRTAPRRGGRSEWDAAGYYRVRGVVRTRWGYAQLVDNPNNDTRRPGVIEFIPGSGPRRR